MTESIMPQENVPKYIKSLINRNICLLLIDVLLVNKKTKWDVGIRPCGLFWSKLFIEVSQNLTQ